eukprot:TRINITY_DN1042_c0_g2_i1.p1 TRINITY_DN1042_c0_g2~~TRINITY_DN1042_c0_g2_i1.p1  ORF type:complete len:229 (+),score=53.93 TRINITY_DN1042_c0_g2_i1:104-790(+)
MSFSMRLFVLVAFVTIMMMTTCQGHMMMSHPSVWGRNSQKWELQNPLNSGTRNWFMHGAKKDTNSQLTLRAGGSVTIPIICGGAYGQEGSAASKCRPFASALHKGGGCALSIAYKSANSVTKDDFTIFSVNYDCPNSGINIPFRIPSNLPSCADCVCAWTWIPNEESSTNEMYMNGFNCKVEGGSGRLTGGPKLTYFAVPGGRNPGFRPRYNQPRTGIKNGAQTLQVQ